MFYYMYVSFCKQVFLNCLSDTACMSTEMTFKELFEHLEMYLYDKDQRWKYVMRVKRSLADCSELGGCGFDQCYFEGECCKALYYMPSPVSGQDEANLAL